MQLLLEALTYHRYSDEPLSVVVILIIRVTLVLLTGWLISLLCARRSAAWEHQVWLLTLLATLLVPVVWAVTPAWRVPLVAIEVSDRALDTTRLMPGGQVPGGVIPSTGMLNSGGSTAPANWPHVLVAAWIAGATLALSHALWSVGCAMRMVRVSRACRCPEWQGVLNEVRQEMGFARAVELRWAPRGSSPAVWGWRRVRVMVPVGSQRWSRSEQKDVVMHELAHAARRDCQWRLFTNLVCGLWWFHPLVWVAAARLRSAGERAADDCVVHQRGNAAEYAQHLVTIATRLSGLPMTGAAPTMIRASQLEGRLRNLLTLDRDRAPLGRRGRWGTCLGMAGLAWALATWTPSVVRATDPAASGSPPSKRSPEERLKSGGPAVLVEGDEGQAAPAQVILTEPNRGDWSAQATTVPAGTALKLLSTQDGAGAAGGSELTKEQLEMLRMQEAASRARGFRSRSDEEFARLKVTIAPGQGKPVVPYPAPPEGPPAAKLHLLPNWEAGRKADAVLPNFQPGTAKVQLLAPPAAQGPVVAVQDDSAQPEAAKPEAASSATPPPAKAPSLSIRP